QTQQVWPVPPFPTPDPQKLPAHEELAQNESVQLFVERVTAARPGFALTAANAPEVALICRRLDGIPLALELAAARISDRTLSEIGAQLEGCLGLQDNEDLMDDEEDERIDVEGRHRTLRATIDWSYRLQRASEQRLFRQLSVFMGGWTREAASAIC